MKKVLSFVLVLSLVLGSFSMAFAATPTDVVGKTCEDAVRALSDLGVVSGYTDGTYKPENPVNRAEACKLIISALGLDAYAEGKSNTNFTDLDGYGWAVGYIAYAEQLGLVKGVGNGKFNPGGPVTYEQWATMLVRALGYNDEVLPGTWPANYMIKAQSLHIMKNISAAGNAAANRGDVAIMLYNNMDNNIGYINKDNEWIANVGPAGGIGGDTMMNRLIKDEDPAGVKVFDNAGVAEGLNLRSYLGAYALAYVNDDGDIIGFKEVKSTFVTGDWDKAKQTFSVDDVDYDVKGTAQAMFPVEFNNGRDMGVTTAAFGTWNDEDNITLAVKISGKTITEVYSAQRWDINLGGTAAQFEDGDLNTSKCKLLGQEFEKNNNGEIDTTSFELVGVSSLDKIAEDNIVEVFTHPGTNKITKVAVGTEVVEGEVTKINTGATKYTVNGKTYKVDGAVTNALGMGPTDFPDVTDEGKMYLTAAGKFAYWDETDAAAGNYAIYMGYEYSEDYGKRTTDVKLFTKEGKEVEYTLKDWDLTTKNTVPALVTDTAVNTVVKFSVNASGKLDTMTTYGPETLYGTANKAGTSFANTAVKSSVVVFVYDAIDDEWSLGSMKDISTDKNQKVGWDGAAPQGIVNRNFIGWDGKNIGAIAVTDSASSSEDSFGIIDSYAKGKNSKGDKVWRAAGFLDGKELDAATINDSDFANPWAVTTTDSGLQKIKVNGEGEVKLVATALTSELEDYLTEGAVNFDGTGRNDIGLAATKINTADHKITVMTSATEEKEQTLDAKAVVYLWDSDEEEWTMTDIKGLKNADNCYVTFYQTDDKYDDFNVVIAWEAKVD